MYQLTSPSPRPIFVLKLQCSLKKKSHHFKSLSDFTLFVLKTWCSLKKRSSPRIPSHFSNFVPKQMCSLLSCKIKVIAQKFVGHATHDLHALTAHHWRRDIMGIDIGVGISVGPTSQKKIGGQ